MPLPSTYRTKRHPLVALICLWLLLPLSALAEGDVFLLPSSNPAGAIYADVVATGTSGFIAVWQAAGVDGSSDGICARRYSVAGAPIGDQVIVNSTINGAQTAPSVAADAAGNFVAVWTDDTRDGKGSAVCARRFAADGTPKANDFLVNNTTTGNQGWASVAMAPDGRFLIVWQSQNQDGSGYGIYGQRYAADGTKSGSEFRVNASTSGDQVTPSVTCLSSGNYAVAWASLDSGSRVVIRTRTVSSTGTLGTETGMQFLGSTPTADYVLPAVAANPAGGFGVVFDQESPSSGKGGVYFAEFGADGAQTRPASMMSEGVTLEAIWPDLVYLPSGRALATYGKQSSPGSTNENVYIRALARTGGSETLESSEILLDSGTGSQGIAKIAVAPSGDSLVVWSHIGNPAVASSFETRGAHFDPVAPMNPVATSAGGLEIAFTWQSQPCPVSITSRLASTPPFLTADPGANSISFTESKPDWVHAYKFTPVRKLAIPEITNEVATPMAHPVEGVPIRLVTGPVATKTAVKLVSKPQGGFRVVSVSGNSYYIRDFTAEGSAAESTRLAGSFLQPTSSPAAAWIGSDNCILVVGGSSAVDLISLSGTASTTGSIQTGTGAGASRKAVAPLSTGNALVAWKRKNGGNDEVVAAVYGTALQQIGSPVVLASGTASLSAPLVERMDDGRFAIVWSRRASGGDEIWSAVLGSNGALQSPAALRASLGESSLSGVDVASVSGGKAAIVWVERLGLKNTLNALVVDSSGGTAVGTVTLRNEVQTRDSMPAVVAFPSPLGGFLSVWRENDRTFIAPFDSACMQTAKEGSLGWFNSSSIMLADLIGINGQELVMTYVANDADAGSTFLGSRVSVGSFLTSFQGNATSSTEVALQWETVGQTPDAIRLTRYSRGAESLSTTLPDLPAVPSTCVDVIPPPPVAEVYYTVHPVHGGIPGPGVVMDTNIFMTPDVLLGDELVRFGPGWGIQTPYGELIPQADGRYRAIWAARSSSPGYPTGIYTQWFDASGVPVGGPERLVTVERGDAVTTLPLPSGGFLLAWLSNRTSDNLYLISVAIFDSDGDEVVPTFVAGKSTTGELPGFAPGPDGGFYISWVGSTNDGSVSGMILARYDADGSPAGLPLLISSPALNTYEVGLAVHPHGHILATWWEDPADESGITAAYAKAFSSDLGSSTSTIRLSPENERGLRPAALPGAGPFWHIGWVGPGADQALDCGFYVGRYSLDLEPENSAVQANPEPYWIIRKATMAADPSGYLVAGWERTDGCRVARLSVDAFPDSSLLNCGSASSKNLKIHIAPSGVTVVSSVNGNKPSGILIGNGRTPSPVQIGTLDHAGLPLSWAPMAGSVDGLRLERRSEFTSWEWMAEPDPNVTQTVDPSAAGPGLVLDYRMRSSENGLLGFPGLPSETYQSAMPIDLHHGPRRINRFSAGAQDLPQFQKTNDGGIRTIWRSTHVEHHAGAIRFQDLDSEGRAIGSERHLAPVQRLPGALLSLFSTGVLPDGTLGCAYRVESVIRAAPVYGFYDELHFSILSPEGDLTETTLFSRSWFIGDIRRPVVAPGSDSFAVYWREYAAGGALYPIKRQIIGRDGTLLGEPESIVPSSDGSLTYFPNADGSYWLIHQLPKSSPTAVRMLADHTQAPGDPVALPFAPTAKLGEDFASASFEYFNGGWEIVVRVCDVNGTMLHGPAKLRNEHTAAGGSVVSASNRADVLQLVWSQNSKILRVSYDPAGGFGSIEDVTGYFSTGDLADCRILGDDAGTFFVASINKENNRDIEAFLAPAPPAPEDFHAEPSPEAIQLAWASYAAETYALERSDGGDPFALLSQDSITAGSYLDATAPGGLELQYRIAARNEFGISPWTYVTTLRPPTLDEWNIIQFGSEHPEGDGAAFADFDGDGLLNIQEYALGSDPHSAQSAPFKQRVVEEAGQRYLSIRFRRWPGMTATPTVAAYGSSPAGPWEDGILMVDDVVRNPDGTESVSYRDPVPFSGSPARFGIIMTRQTTSP